MQVVTKGRETSETPLKTNWEQLASYTVNTESVAILRAQNNPVNLSKVCGQRHSAKDDTQTTSRNMEKRLVNSPYQGSTDQSPNDHVDWCMQQTAKPFFHDKNSSN